MHSLNFYLRKHLPPVDILQEEWAAPFPTSTTGNLAGLFSGAGLGCASSAGQVAGAHPDCPHHPQGGQHWAPLATAGGSLYRLSKFSSMKSNSVDLEGEKCLVLTQTCASLGNRTHFAQRAPKPRAQTANSSQPKLQSPQERRTPLCQPKHDTVGQEPLLQGDWAKRTT